MLIITIILPQYGLADTDLFAVSYTTYDTTYDAILKMYVKVINAFGTKNTGRHDLYNSLVINDFNSVEASNEYKIKETKNRVGFCIYDLNNDGIDELIIGEDPSYVYEVFTTDNGKVRELIRAGYNYECALLQGGQFYRKGHGGASMDSYAIWSMNGTKKIKFAEGFIRNDQPNDTSLPWKKYNYFFRMTEPRKFDYSAENLVDKYTFLSWIKSIDKEVLQLHFVPLAIYEQGYNGDYESLGIITVKGKTTGIAKVRIRTKPSSKSKILKICKVGTIITILGEEDDYYKIQTGNKEGYVQKDYLTKLSDATNGRKYSIGADDYARLIEDPD